MFSNLTGWHALVILAIVLLVFGSTKLPALAKSVGQSVRILKDEVQVDSTPRAVPVASEAVASDSVASDPVEERRAS